MRRRFYEGTWKKSREGLGGAVGAATGRLLMVSEKVSGLPWEDRSF
jgi:hypothetical protein